MSPLSRDRCPKCNTAHADSAASGTLVGAVLGSLIGLQARSAGHRPFGVPLIFCEAVLAIAFTVGVALTYAIWAAHRRGWLS